MIYTAVDLETARHFQANTAGQRDISLPLENSAMHSGDFIIDYTNWNYNISHADDLCVCYIEWAFSNDFALINDAMHLWTTIEYYILLLDG